MIDQRSEMPDEDAFDFPETWLRHVHPRRGGVRVPPVKAGDPDAARRLVDTAPEPVAELLAGEARPEWSAAARRQLDGAPDPAGAAALAAAVLSSCDYPRKCGDAPVFVDSWAAGHGAAFAACAAARLCETELADGRTSGKAQVFDISGHTALLRARTLLAAADDAAYAAAAEQLDALEWGPDEQGLGAWIIAYLLPTRQDRVDGLLASGVSWGRIDRLALCSLGRPGQLDAVLPRLGRRSAFLPDVPATALDGLGTDVLPLFADMVRSGHGRDVFGALAVLPTDDAFRVLLERRGDKEAKPALMDARRRFPVRAARVLTRTGGPQARALLDRHVRRNTGLFTDAFPALPDDVRAAVGPVLRAVEERVPDAPAAALPECLSGPPPWKRPVKPVVPGLEAPEPRIVWPEGLRERWLAADIGEIERIPDPDWPELIARMDDRRAGKVKLNVMLFGPEDLVRPLVARWDGYVGHHVAGEWRQVLVARFGMDARHLVVPGSDLMLPFLSAKVAAYAAGGRSGAGMARNWLELHGTAAVPYLAPAALGASGKERGAAEDALRRIASRHGLDAVVEAFPGAPDELRTLLAAHPAQTGLAEPAKIGAWPDRVALPQVLLRGGERALPVSEVRRLLELLTLPVPYALDELRAAFEPASVAELGWDVFCHWDDLCRPSKEGWALTQLGRSGDDEAVRRLAPMIRAWPGEGGHKYAVTGLDVLAGIGSDVALMHLHSISQKVRFKGLRERAKDKVGEVAEVRGLSLDELADRVVPSCGLDADGSMTLDYGPRRFTVRFDELLKPVVADETGKIRKALPKPGAKDDPELAPAAHKAFAALKKDVRTVAADQLRRLERAMVAGRRWTPDEFGAHLVRHPLVGHLARRLVWTADEGAAFRVAEDGTFADAGDEAFVLPEPARVGIAHPLHLGESLKAWAEVFADYEILQPFEQLARPVHAFTEDERGSGRLARFEGLTVPFGTLLGLEKRGWERAEPGDGGSQEYMFRRVADDRYVVIDLDPGFTVGVPDGRGDEQYLECVRLAAEPGGYRRTRSVARPFGELDPVTASELLADLTVLSY